MKRYFFLLILLALFVSTELKSQDNFHQLIENSGDAKKYPGANILVIFDSTYVRVKESGLSYAREHKLIKMLNDAGAKSFVLYTMDYDPQSANVEVLGAKIYHKNGEILEIGHGKIYDYPAPARMIYWGARQKAIEFGFLEPGDAIEIMTLRKGFTYALLQDDDDRFIPPMRGHFYDIVPFWVSNPTLEKAYCLEIPSDKPLQYKFYNGTAESKIVFGKKKRKETEVLMNPTAKTDEKREEKSEIQIDSGLTLYCWSKKDISPFQYEANMVSPSDVAEKLLLSTSPDWRSKSLWFYGVNENYGSFEVSPEVQKKTDELLSGVSDEIKKIEILNHWVAEEIRYSGISMGEGEGYTLHKGQMTFSDRCGVCKDKAGMLVTMLRAAGFESYAAMTMAGSRIEKIPADQFNHSVTVAKLKNGKWILLDPTWIPGVREMWSSAEQQQEFLMGIPEGADLQTTPVSPPENHYWKIDVKSQLGNDASLKGTLTVEAEGQSDAMIRRSLSRSWLSYAEEYIPEYMSNMFPQAKIDNIETTDVNDLSKPMRIKFSFYIPDFARYANGRFIFTPISALNPFRDGYMSPELAIDTSFIEKKYGFRIRCSKLFLANETLTIPAGFKIMILPEFKTLNERDNSSFEARYQAKGNEIKLTASHSMGKRVYEKEDWKTFREALIERHKLMNSQIIIEK